MVSLLDKKCFCSQNHTSCPESGLQIYGICATRARMSPLKYLADTGRRRTSRPPRIWLICPSNCLSMSAVNQRLALHDLYIHKTNISSWTRFQLFIGRESNELLCLENQHSIQPSPSILEMDFCSSFWLDER